MATRATATLVPVATLTLVLAGCPQFLADDWHIVADGGAADAPADAPGNPADGARDARSEAAGDGPSDAPEDTEAHPSDGSLEAADGTVDGPVDAPPEANCPGTEVSCGGTCTNTDSDPANCGACGHDCLGSTCQQAVCEAEVLATITSTPYAMAVDANNVYYTTYSGGTVMQLPKIGGAAFAIANNQAPPPGGGPIQLATDGTNVYWAVAANVNLGAIRTVPIGGGTVTTLASGQSMYGSLVLGTSGIYFATYSEISEIPLTGADGGSFTNVQADGGDLWMTSDGVNLYWLEFQPTMATIEQMPISGGTPIPLGTTPSGTGQLVTDGKNVYASAGTVVAVPVGGGTEKVLAPNGNGISTDGANVYFTVATPQVVERVAVDGGPRVVLAKNQASPSVTAVDQFYVYWSSGTTMYRTPK